MNILLEGYDLLCDIYLGRVENRDSIKIGKVFYHNKLQFPIKQNHSKKHKLKMIPSATKSDSILDFVRNKKKAEEGIVEPIYDLFPKFLAVNLIVKMPQRVVLNIYQTFKITMLNVNTVRVRLNMI